MALISALIHGVLWGYLAILTVRMVLSLLPLLVRQWEPRGVLLVIAEFTYTVTDPPLRFLRRFLPTPRVADISRIITVHPRTYNEARTIGENFRDGVPVIMNLSDMEDSDAKRLVDFSAGLIFGLRGSIERITSKVFLLSPHNVTVSVEDKERLAGGFFNQS